MSSVERTGKRNVSIQGDLTLEEISELHRALVEAELPEDATVDLSGVGRFDLPGLQLLYALNGEKRRFEFGDNASRFARMARFAGFTPLPGSEVNE